MSGGHYNYAYFKIQELSESILEDLADESQYFSDKVHSVMTRFAAELLEISDKAKALEWFMSADDNEEDLLENFKVGKKYGG